MGRSSEYTVIWAIELDGYYSDLVELGIANQLRPRVKALLAAYWRDIVLLVVVIP